MLRTIVFLVLLGSCVLSAHADDYFEMSLEELMQVEITSVAKKPQKIGASPAAIFIITAEDIRRSSANSIVELLRMVPGMQVARIDNNHWSVSARGFDGQFSNKLLVLLDGRTLYSPLFSGTFWDDQDTMLEDIERIEVIRGPGGTIWGANAVNGVINIITKEASASVGTLIAGGGGSQKKAFARVRQGVKLSESTAARMYAKYDRKESSEEILSGQDGEDSEEDGRVGFRVDSTPSDEDQLTLQGDMYNYDGGIALYAPDPGSPVGGGRIGGNKESQGGNIVGRWKHKFQKDSDVEFQLYYDRVERDEVVVDFTVDTIDSEFMHRYRFDKQLELQWGAGFRHIRDKIAQSSAVNYSPPEKNYDLYTGFAQLESELLEDQLTFTLGSKIESNEFSGFNYQPSASLIWSPKETQFVWVSASRAVRTPSRGGEDVSFVAGVTPLPGGGIGILQYDGADLPAEVLQAYELGYRFKPIDEVYVDIATFYNDYSQLVEASSAGNPIVPGGAGEPVIIPLTNFPTGEAKTYGVELSISSRPLNWLNLQASYWSIKIDQDEAQASAFETLGTAENKATLRALMDLSDEVELDLYYRYVDRIGGSGVPAYSELDSRVGWSPWDGVELALIANNLLDSGHQEATGDVLRLAATEVEREYWGRATITF